MYVYYNIIFYALWIILFTMVNFNGKCTIKGTVDKEDNTIINKDLTYKVRFNNLGHECNFYSVILIHKCLKLINTTSF